MNPFLKEHLDRVSEESGLIANSLNLLIKEKLTLTPVKFFETAPGKDFFKRIHEDLLEKAAGYTDKNRPTIFNLDLSTSEEVEAILKYKDEIIDFLKKEIGIEVSDWYQNMEPMSNSTFVRMTCIK